MKCSINIIKGIYKVPTVSINLHEEKLKMFCIVEYERIFIFFLLFYIILEVPARGARRRKAKGTKTEETKFKLPLQMVRSYILKTLILHINY